MIKPNFLQITKVGKHPYNRLKISMIHSLKTRPYSKGIATKIMPLTSIEIKMVRHANVSKAGAFTIVRYAIVEGEYK